MSTTPLQYFPIDASLLVEQPRVPQYKSSGVAYSTDDATGFSAIDDGADGVDGADGADVPHPLQPLFFS